MTLVLIGEGGGVDSKIYLRICGSVICFPTYGVIYHCGQSHPGGKDKLSEYVVDLSGQPVSTCGYIFERTQPVSIRD